MLKINHKPLVGILLATYNGEKFLEEQINSILNQSYQNWQLVIHDDCSTDLTIKIIEKFAKKYPDKINFIKDGVKCGGAKENFSHLINIVNKNYDFEYIMFADQDDVWLPDKVEITLKKMYEAEQKYGKHTPILIHTDLKVADEKLNIISNSFWKFQKLNPKKSKFNHLLVQNNVTGCTTLINRSLLKKSVSIPEDAIMHDWWIALIAASFGKIIPIYEPTVLYRQHKNNDTGAKNFNFKYIFSKLSDRNSIVNSIKKTFRQAEAFKSIFSKDLNIAQKLILDNYVSLKNNCFLKKLIIINKNGFFKQGLLRNIGFIYYILKGI